MSEKYLLDTNVLILKARQAGLKFLLWENTLG